jgi:hypothetical protein
MKKIFKLDKKKNSKNLMKIRFKNVKNFNFYLKKIKIINSQKIMKVQSKDGKKDFINI